MAARPLPLPLWDRRAGKLVYEFMDDAPSTYESQPRRSLNQWLESHPLYDWILAAYQNSRLSARKIAPFIRKHRINMDEFEPVAYRSYAEFFERRFRQGVRPFPSEPASMGAFAEARYLAWERLDQTQEFPIKGHSLDANGLATLAPGLRSRGATCGDGGEGHGLTVIRSLITSKVALGRTSFATNSPLSR